MYGCVFHLHDRAVKKGLEAARGIYSTWFYKLTGFYNNHICTTYTAV